MGMSSLGLAMRAQRIGADLQEMVEVHQADAPGVTRMSLSWRQTSAARELVVVVVADRVGDDGELAIRAEQQLAGVPDDGTDRHEDRVGADAAAGPRRAHERRDLRPALADRRMRVGDDRDRPCLGGVGDLAPMLSGIRQCPPALACPGLACPGFACLAFRVPPTWRIRALQVWGLQGWGLQGWPSGWLAFAGRAGGRRGGAGLAASAHRRTRSPLPVIAVGQQSCARAARRAMLWCTVMPGGRLRSSVLSR